MVENPHGGELNMVMFDTDEEDDSIRYKIRTENNKASHTPISPYFICDAALL